MAMQLPKIPFVVLDTETTGFIPKVNRVIEYAHLVFRDGKQTETYEQLIEIPSDIPSVVQVLTRIRPDMLKEQPTFAAVQADILKHMGEDTLIIGQNVSFDIRMLRGEGMDLTDRPWIDTSMLASLVFPELESYSLGYVSTVLELHHEPVHRALGDVHATLELFEKCWERLLELPQEMLLDTKAIMQKSAPGYRMLFDALPTGTATKKPKWMRMPEVRMIPENPRTVELRKPAVGIVDLIEEPIDPGFLQSIINVAVHDESTVHWIAVKNLTATARRLQIPKGVRVLQPPFLMLDKSAEQQFRAEKSLSADEATLMTKLDWYEPSVFSEAPIHGEEKSVWNGKLACTERSKTYTDQFLKLPTVVLLDHRQLLDFIQDPNHAAHGALNEKAHIIIDDASMLEDTASKAYGFFCGVPDLRAAAQGNEALTRCTDLLQIWIEKTRNEQDVRFLAPSDLHSGDAAALRSRIAQLRSDTTAQPLIQRLLKAVEHCLEEDALKRITWIEVRQDGTQCLSSIPESVAELLKRDLYDLYPVTLLIPPQSAGTLQEALHRATKAAVNTVVPRVQDGVTASVSHELNTRKVLSDPPDGKTIILAGSRRVIEEYFVEFTEGLENRGITLICQNLSGGINRMQAEFLAAKAPAVWVLTPWTFESVELPAGTLQHLIIDALPFDNPSQPVFGKRAEHFRNAFAEYSMPRLLHRMFRILRTFRRISNEDSDIVIIDKRMTEKAYGKTVRHYVELCTEKLTASTKRTTNSDFPENWQMNLF